VPILSVSEFEAVLGQVCIKIDKALSERGDVPSLEEARRDLDNVMQNARDGKKVKLLRKKLESASETVCGEIGGDEKLRDDLWDCIDYVDYRL